MKMRFRPVISTTVVLLVIWIFLTLSLDPQELVLGFAVSVIIASATGGCFTGNLFRLLHPGRFLAATGYVLYFLGQMVMANLDVIFRVLKPVVPVKPGIVKARLTLKNPRARTIVANSITLTPGTLTMDIMGDDIFVHWISLPDGDVHAETQKMVDGFASRLEKIFG